MPETSIWLQMQGHVYKFRLGTELSPPGQQCYLNTKWNDLVVRVKITSALERMAQLEATGGAKVQQQ